MRVTLRIRTDVVSVALGQYVPIRTPALKLVADASVEVGFFPLAESDQKGTSAEGSDGLKARQPKVDPHSR
jgi:hypothetical protein